MKMFPFGVFIVQINENIRLLTDTIHLVKLHNLTPLRERDKNSLIM